MPLPDWKAKIFERLVARHEQRLAEEEAERGKPGQDDQLVTVEVAAKMLGMSVDAVRRAVSRRSGSLPEVVRIGRRVRFRKSELLARLDGARTEGRTKLRRK
jgi:excisionase family DNA binding protein